MTITTWNTQVGTGESTPTASVQTLEAATAYVKEWRKDVAAGRLQTSGFPNVPKVPPLAQMFNITDAQAALILANNQ